MIHPKLRRSDCLLAFLLGLQIILTCAFPAYRIGAYLLALFVLLGVPFIGLLNAIDRGRPWSYSLAPVITVVVITIIGAFLLGMDGAIWLLPVGLLVTSVSCAVAARVLDGRSSPVTSERDGESFRACATSVLLISTPVLLLSLLPLLGQVRLGSPFRFGPDIAFYAKMVQYYLDGGTWSAANASLAEYASMGAIEINRYSDATLSWSPAYNFRWGLTMYQSLVALLTKSTHAFESVFVSMAIINVLVGLTVHRLLVFVNPTTSKWTTLASIAICLNSNLLYIWTEGFHANFLAVLLFTFVVYLIALAHPERFAACTPGQAGAVSLGQAVAPHVVLALAVLSMTLSYTEGVFFILVPFLGTTLLVSLRKSLLKTPKKTLMTAGAVILGVVAAIPCGFLHVWLPMTIRQLKEAGGNGYMQPHWANPAEIIGLLDLYTPCSVAKINQLIPRSQLEMTLALLYTSVLCGCLFRSWRKASSGLRALFISATVIVLMTYVAVGIKSPGNNYTYMKTYVFYVPVLTTVVLSLVSACAKGANVTWSSTVAYFIPPAMIALIGLNGLLFLEKYQREQTFISQDEIRLQRIAKLIDLNSALVVPQLHRPMSFPTKCMKLSCLAAIINTRWFFQERWSDPHWGSRVRDRRIYVLQEKSAYAEKAAESSVIYEDDQFVFFDTGRHVSQLP